MSYATLLDVDRFLFTWIANWVDYIGPCSWIFKWTNYNSSPKRSVNAVVCARYRVLSRELALTSARINCSYFESHRNFELCFHILLFCRLCHSFVSIIALFSALCCRLGYCENFAYAEQRTGRLFDSYLDLSICPFTFSLHLGFAWSEYPASVTGNNLHN